VKGLARFLQNVPRWLLAFAALHMAFGLLLFVSLVSLVLSHCVDPPLPQGTYAFDGCSAFRDPWRDGTWPYDLAIAFSFIASSALILRAQRFGRWWLLLAIISVFIYAFHDFFVLVKDTLQQSQVPATQRDSIAVWAEFLSTYVTPLSWIFPISWVAFDSWFLFWHSRKHFARAAQNGHEKR
jgi:hypothetical protein